MTARDRPHLTDRQRVDLVLDELRRLQDTHQLAQRELTAANVLRDHLIHEVARLRGITEQVARTIYTGESK